MSKLFTKLTALAAVALLATASLPLVAQAVIPLPPSTEVVSSEVSVTMNCTNNPGPQVTLSGNILIGTFPVEIALYQNKNKQETLVYQTEVQLGLGSPVVFPKQGFTGNPIITLQLMMNGKPHGDPVNMGRCVQGSKKVIPVPTELVASLLAEVLDCNNSPGPKITISGTQQLLDGVSLVITGKNNSQGTHTQTKTATIVEVGASFPLDPVKEIPKQEVGGNPIVYVNGHRLGRCNKI